MTGLFQDIRYGCRILQRNPGFSIVAVLTLALGIGANTAIFSVVNTVLLAHLPYRDVDRLAMIWGSNLARGEAQTTISAGDFTEWKEKNNAFEDIAASYDNEVTLTGAGEPKLVLGYALTPNYFQILGVGPKLGRTFSEEEARPGGPNVVVLSDKFWRNTLHGDARIIGQSITLDAKPHTVVGVMPPDFNYPALTELWMPMAISGSVSGDYEHRYIRVVGRLKPGVSLSEAEVRMNALERQIAAAHPTTDAGNGASVESLRQHLAGDIRTPLLVLLGAVGFVLFIACANVASLLLMRAANRRKEVSVRVALGAGRVRLLRQFLTESLLLSLLGGGLGVLLAYWCAHLLLAIFPNDIANLSIPRVDAIPMNANVLWFALGITGLTGLVFGVVPAMQSAGAEANDVLKDSGRGLTFGSRSVRLRRALVVAEIAISLVLLAGAGLFAESFRRVARGDLGFRTDHVLAIEVFLPPNRYPSEQAQKQRAFVHDVLGRLRTLPDVQSVAATNFLPLTGFWGTADFLIEGQPLPKAGIKPLADNRLATAEYFSTMGIAVLRGRVFTESDRAGSEPVAIINAALGQKYFGSEDPVGKVLDLGSPDHPERRRIVGLVSDVRAFGPDQPAHADLYRPIDQVWFPLLAFTVRTAGDPSAVLKSAEQAVWDVDKDQPIFHALPMSLLAEQSVTLRRVSTVLLAAFATLALVLASVGLYGVMAYTVAQRSHEIGIRMALGAQYKDVVGMILGQGARLVLIGEAIGLVAVLTLTRTLAGLLYGIEARDPSTLAGVSILLALVALLALYIPAHRAAKGDPTAALRYE